MSARKALYEATRDRIRGTMPWVRSIDLQKGQFASPENNYPLPLPCALIEIKPLAWENASGKIQIGETIVSVYLIFDDSSDTVAGSAAEQKSLEILDKMDEPFYKLTDLSSISFKRFVRKGDGFIRYYNRIIELRTDFYTTLLDSIPQRTAQLSVDPQLTVSGG